MSQALGREHNFFSLLKFALPTMIMMMFMSLYSIVDGIFVSRLVGTHALSAVNIVFPISSLVIAVSVMLGTGGSACVARNIGTGDLETAKNTFSMLTLTAAIAGVVIGVVGFIFAEPLSRMLGANDILLPYCLDYLRLLIVFAPAAMLQMLFQTFFVTAGKPGLGLALTIVAGIGNAILDYVFMGPMQMGVMGAALGTAVSYLVPSVAGLIYFALKKDGLRFVKPKFNAAILLESCGNGSSEMVTNLSSAVITFLFNIVMMKRLGTDGVAAITVVLYAQFLFTALYLGFSIGVAPVISFHYGGKNTGQLRKIFKISLYCTGAASLLVFAVSLLLGETVVNVFIPKGDNAYILALRGFTLFAASYLFSGLNIFTSAAFTALSDGKTSAILSFLRTFGFIAVSILILPQIIGNDGIWLAVPVAELLTLIFSGRYLMRLPFFYSECSEKDEM